MKLEPFFPWRRESPGDRLRVKSYDFRRIDVQVYESIDGIVKLTFGKQ